MNYYFLKFIRYWEDLERGRAVEIEYCIDTDEVTTDPSIKIEAVNSFLTKLALSNLSIEKYLELFSGFFSLNHVLIKYIPIDNITFFANHSKLDFLDTKILNTWLNCVTRYQVDELIANLRAPSETKKSPIDNVIYSHFFENIDDFEEVILSNIQRLMPIDQNKAAIKCIFAIFAAPKIINSLIDTGIFDTILQMVHSNYPKISDYINSIRMELPEIEKDGAKYFIPSDHYDHFTKILYQTPLHVRNILEIGLDDDSDEFELVFTDGIKKPADFDRTTKVPEVPVDREIPETSEDIHQYTEEYALDADLQGSQSDYDVEL